jgi:hypothetical protein
MCWRDRERAQQATIAETLEPDNGDERAIVSDDLE